MSSGRLAFSSSRLSSGATPFLLLEFGLGGYFFSSLRNLSSGSLATYSLGNLSSVAITFLPLEFGLGGYSFSSLGNLSSGSLATSFNVVRLSWTILPIRSMM